MSIYAYAAGATTLYGNGLAMLEPTVCTVHQKAAGSYELYLQHPITDDLKWKTIVRGNLIKAPVPQAETPLIQIAVKQEPEVVKTRTIWRVNITTSKANGYSRIYQRPNIDSKVLKRLRNGTEYEYLGAVGSNWHRAVASDGTTGYMYTANSVFVRTETETKPVATRPGFSSVVQPRQIRDQYFRIYDTHTDTRNSLVTAYARHISYDYMGNMTKQCNLEGVDVQNALAQIHNAMVLTEDRDIITDLEGTITEDYSFKNGIEILMDPDTGLIHKLEAKLVRDNEDFFLLKNEVIDRGVIIAHGKNLLGVDLRENDENVVTRIVPIGTDKEGNQMLLPEVYVDSPNISVYPTINVQKLEVHEAKVSDDMTVDQAYEKMREAAKAEYDKGADGVGMTLDVNFVQLGDTEEFKQYKNLQQVFLYDTITIRHQPTGFETKAQVAEYEWDAILERYNRLKTGDVLEVTGATIAGFQLPNGGISGTKLTPNAVDGTRLRDLSVTNAKIGTAAITYAKIASATIALLQADAIKAAIAEIEKVVSGTVETNELYASIIQAVTASIDKVTSGQITTNDLYAQIIKAVALEIGHVTAGQVETNELYAQIIRAAAAELGKVTAATVDANKLYASLVKALKADLARVTSGEIETSELFAVLASVVNITAETADIDFARIKDLVTGEAIITEGVGGKLFIARLSVTDMQVVSAITQELVVKGADGRYYQLTVAGGELIPVAVSMSGEQLQEGSTPGTALVENAITARELNAEKIFADEALMTTLFAGMGTFGEIFAQSAAMPFITTSVIESEAFKLAVASGSSGIEWVDELPEEPVIGKYYADNSVSPPALRRWDGEAWTTISDTEEIAKALTEQRSQLTALNDALELRVTKAEYDLALAGKADQEALSATETSLRQDISGWQARIEATEGDVTTLKLGVEVTEEGVTIRQPDRTSNQMRLAAGSITISAPGREALVISPEESFMPSLRVNRFVRGSLVTTVSGTGAACRIVDQYVE